MFGSGTATDSTSTVMSAVWRAGIAGVWWQLVWVLVTPIFWVLAPILRRLRAVTTADFFDSIWRQHVDSVFAVRDGDLCGVDGGSAIWVIASSECFDGPFI